MTAPPQLPASPADTLLTDALLDPSRQAAAPYTVVRDVTQLLRSGRFDWRDLARALETVKDRVAPELVEQVSATAARLALAAMGRAAQDGPDFAEALALRLQEACIGSDGPEAMLTRVAAVLHEALPFDILTYIEYLPDPEAHDGAMLTRARLAIDNGQHFTWPARYLKIAPDIVRWVTGKNRLIPSIEHFLVSVPGAAALNDSSVTAEYRRRGVQSSITVPRQDSGLLLGAISLARRKTSPPFLAEHQALLDRLRLDHVMRLVNVAYKARDGAVAAKVTALFDAATSQEEVAREVVSVVAEGFGWDYVGLFRVNRIHGEFQVIAQHDSKGGALQLERHYAQPLIGPGSGMIGATRDAGHILRVGDVRPPNPCPPDWRPPYEYIRSRDAQVSAMTVPIKLGHEVEWVLDCESSQADGFLQPDEDAMRALVQNVERTLALWFESWLNKALFRSTQQGIVVLSENGCIERLNPAARRLLGAWRETRPERDPVIGKQLASFGADPASQDLLATTRLLVSSMQVRLRGADGQERLAQVTAREPEHSFNRKIWLLDDLAEAGWIADLQNARETVQDVAAQTRGPLMLAGALLRQARKLLAETSQPVPVDELLDRATRAVGKADFSYERLASGLDMMREPVRPGRLAAFDIVQTLRNAAAALPRDDAATLRLDMPELLLVRADAERMLLALRAILAALLAACPPGGLIRLEAGEGDGFRLRAWLEEGDEEFDAAARETLAKALRPAEAVLHAHGASVRHAEPGGALLLEISGLAILPAPSLNHGTTT